jgi:hypothetical protein
MTRPDPTPNPLVAELTGLIGEFYASDTALAGYTDSVMAKWLVERIPALPHTAHPSPDGDADADEATVWRVCQAQRDDLVCKHCPRWEDSHCGKVQRGCFAVANELVNIVQTGNPWRKTKLSARAERSGWVVLPAFLEAQSAPSTGVQPRPSREDVAWAVIRARIADYVDALPPPPEGEP